MQADIIVKGAEVIKTKDTHVIAIQSPGSEIEFEVIIKHGTEQKFYKVKACIKPEKGKDKIRMRLE